MERIIYFSPHLDDAALSCACRIAGEVYQGHEVWVVTLFTSADAENSQAYQCRRQEDERAMAILGARFLHLGLLDAPYRDSHYQSFTRIIFGTAPADHAFLRHVVVSMQQVLDAIKPACVVLPLAVGRHIDHRLCFEAGQMLETTARMEHYEDQPYSLVRHSTRMRLLEIGRAAGKETAPSIFGDAFRSEFSESFRNSHYVLNYCADAQEIEQAVQMHLEILGRYFQCMSLASAIQKEPIADVSRQRHRAISCYQSQLSSLYQDFKDFRKKSSDAIEQERYWLLMPSDLKL